MREKDKVILHSENVLGFKQINRFVTQLSFIHGQGETTVQLFRVYECYMKISCGLMHIGLTENRANLTMISRLTPTYCIRFGTVSARSQILFPDFLLNSSIKTFLNFHAVKLDDVIRKIKVSITRRACISVYHCIAPPPKLINNA